MSAAADGALLALAVLVPWVAGWAWAGAIVGAGPGARSRRLGYGFLLGWFALWCGLRIADGLFGTLPFWPLVAVLLLAAAGARLASRRARVDGYAPAVAPGSRRLDTGLLLFFGALCALHLFFVAVEVLHRPVFPWDAWLNWMYRARAWFEARQLLPMAEPAAWALGEGTGGYNVDGARYPTLVPLVATWVALALGQWSETLVNAPVFLLGVALALVLYGESRALGLPRWAATLGAYLLISLPLVGTHLALAGQADIWLAGFAGLGFTALLRGLAEDERRAVLLGLLLVAAGASVKAEGRIWLLAAGAMVVVVRYPRAALAALAIALVAALLLAVAGGGYLELPLVGALGVKAGVLHLPGFGAYRLQSQALLDDYLSNFLASGTWHLLWPALLLTLAGACFLRDRRLRRVLLAFYAVFLGGQLVIFQLTEQGRWAEDWTAINRLPLQFAPALVYSLLLPVRPVLAAVRAPALRAGGLAAVAALAFSLAGVLAWLALTLPGSGAPAQHFGPGDLAVRTGSMAVRDGRGIVTRYDGNIAIVSRAGLALAAGDLPVLRAVRAGENEKPATFFWRRQDAPQHLESLTLDGGGVLRRRLDREAAWRGTITEVGLVLYADGDRRAIIGGLDLVPFSIAGHGAQLWRDWSQLSFWSQRSVNWLPAGAQGAAVPLPLVLLIATLIGAALALPLARSGARGRGAALVAVALCGWLLLDLRWLVNRGAQAVDTAATYRVGNSAALAYGDDAQLRQLAARVGDGATPLLIATEGGDPRFEPLRVKYHALPRPAYVHAGSLDTLPPQLPGPVLVLRTRYALATEERASAAAWAARLARLRGRPQRVLWDGPAAFLLGAAAPAGEASAR